MNDYISRQEALNALCDNCEHVQAVCPHYPCKQFIAIAEKLPSAEPEIIRCKDCMHFSEDYCELFEMYGLEENDYCSRGKEEVEGEEE